VIIASSFCSKTEGAHRGGAGRVEDRASDRRSRRAGEPILSRAIKKVRALARSLRAAKLGAPLVLDAARSATVHWDV
jgi:hypothetical protein